MQQRCPSCGSPVAPGQRFCGVCGAQISLSCPKCRITVSPGTRFCPSCGTSLGGGPQQQPGGMPQSGWGQQPQPGWGQQPQPGWGQQPQPGWGQQPQPGWDQQPAWAPPAQSPQSSSTRPFLVILLIVLLIGLGGLVYWQFGDDIKGLLGSGGTTTTIDTTKPVISKISATAGPTSARIDWTTDELASTQVEYGKTQDNTSLSELKDDPTSGQSIGVLQHSVILTTGIEPDTTYDYRVKSKDKAGNEEVSDWKTFKTTVPEE